MIATAATTYVMIVALPAANQAFREITFKLLMTRGETKIKPRVFYTDFPNLVIYVREVTPGVGWTDVMVADNSLPMEPKTVPREEGPAAARRGKALRADGPDDGTQHSVNLDEPEKYEYGTFDQTMLVDRSRERVPAQGPMKGPTEMTIAELKGDMAELREAEHLSAQPDHGVAEEVLDSRGVPRVHARGARPGCQQPPRRPARELCARHRRRVRLLGPDVHVGGGREGAALLPYWFAWLAMWVPNIVIGVWGVVLIARKLRGAGTGIHAVRAAVRRGARVPRRRRTAAAPAGAGHARGGRHQVPHFAFPRPSILDWYVLKQGLRVSVLAGGGLLALFYIATFIDLSDHLFKGRTSGIHRS